MPETHNQFENAIERLGIQLGFAVSRPEKEANDGGPDVLWNVGNNTYYVIECKNGAVGDYICKEYCGQLLNSMNWFERIYGKEFKYYPIIVHLTNKFENNASPSEKFRIIDKEKLNELKRSVLDFSNEICSGANYNNPETISLKLNLYNLTNEKFIERYTKSYVINKK